MIAGIAEKLPIFPLLLMLWLQGRLEAKFLAIGAGDGILGILFIIAFLRTKDRRVDEENKRT